ncbi:hypothetical protein [Flindersiella endophytica]
MVATDPPAAGRGTAPASAGPQTSDVGTPIYDALCRELGDPTQRSEAFDQSLVDLDAYIDQTLHGDANGSAKH